MFPSIWSEIKKLIDNFAFISHEGRSARGGGEGNEPIFRMVEAERVHSNFLSIIPAALILFLVEVCGMVWALINKLKFDYGTGFIVSCIIFTVISFVFVCIIESKLKDPDFSLKQKKAIYVIYWILYGIEAMSYAVMELLDRGTVNNFLCFVFIFTVIPIIEPVPKTIVLMLSFLFEAFMMYRIGTADPDLILLCFVAVLIASVVSYAAYFRYMNMKITEKRLEHFANGDQLTMLTNRRGFAELSPSIKKHCLNKSLKLSVIMADIDDFKIYNDTYGHIEGDICLRNVANKIRENFSRPSDICARYGGEEFVILSAINDEKRLIEHVKEFLSEVEEMKSAGGSKVTLSIGICITDNPAKVDMNDLIRIADSELYNAKTSGKNCVSYKGKIYKND